MAFRKVAAAIAACLGADLLMTALLPFLRLVVDPLLLLLIALSTGVRSFRALWLLGLGLGLLKDLYTGTPFGVWACTFTAAAWMIGATRRMIEWGDPAVVGVWAAVLTLLAWSFSGLWLSLADPFIQWGQGQLAFLPVAMAVQGFSAAWAFPRLQKLLGKPVPSYRF